MKSGTKRGDQAKLSHLIREKRQKNCLRKQQWVHSRCVKQAKILGGAQLERGAWGSFLRKKRKNNEERK